MKLIRGVGLGILLMVSSLFAEPIQLKAPEPVQDFFIPVFGKDGYKIWDLRGKEGLFINENNIEIQGLYLCVYGNASHQGAETIIESLEAKLNPRDGLAIGKNDLFVSSKNFNIMGTGWSWNGKERRIEIKRNARVTFDQKLINLQDQK